MIEEVNAIANHPSVRQMMFLGAVYPPQELDFSDCIEDARNVTLTHGGFAAMFLFRGPGIYECHIMALKEARGAFAFEIGHAMLDHMKGLGAKLIWGQPSIYNRAAICYIRRMGLKPAGFGQDIIAGEVQYFVMEL